MTGGPRHGAGGPITRRRRHDLAGEDELSLAVLETISTRHDRYSSCPSRLSEMSLTQRDWPVRAGDALASHGRESETTRRRGMRCR